MQTNQFSEAIINFAESITDRGRKGRPDATASKVYRTPFSGLDDAKASDSRSRIYSQRNGHRPSLSVRKSLAQDLMNPRIVAREGGIMR